jgi:TnpA family transposase
MNIEILTKTELKHFNSVQSLNYKEKEYYFKIKDTLLQKLQENYKIENIAIFIHLFGYFKLTCKFFNINNDILEYISKRYKLQTSSKKISERTLRTYKQIIRKYFEINSYSDNIKFTFQKEANNLANNFIHRKKIFYTLVNLSKKLNIEVPSYTELTRIITIALNTQKKDILDNLKLLQEDKRLESLNEFLEKEETSKNRYKITYFRKLEHSTAKNQMVLSLEKLDIIKSNFDIFKEIIDTIGITPKIAKYYTKWVEKGKIFQLNQMNTLNQKFTLLSFIYYQYLIRNDNLIDRFIATVQSAKNSSLRAQKDLSFELEPKKNKVLELLEDTNLSILNEIEAVIKNEKLSAIKKVIAIENLVTIKTQQLKKILEEKKAFNAAVDNKYNFIEKKSISLQGKLSGVLKTIEFDDTTSNKSIIAAIKYFRETSNITAKSPKEFLSDEEKNAVYNSGKFKISLYKALLFFHVSDAIKNGTLNLKYSLKYRNFENYLIDKSEWKKNKNTLLKIHELEALKDYECFIKPIKEKLEHSFNQTNENIKKGFNTYFTASDDSYILKTPKLDKKEDEKSISKYFPSNEYISVIDLMRAINKEVDFLSSFQHYSQGKSKTNHNLLLAALLGYGCNLSLPKMGKISKGINENQLDNVKTWYMSEENTNEANDKIIAFMDNLKIVKLMRANQDINHTSSDGQKYNISSSIHSTNAGYSFKYFGTDKGVVVYVFIDESHRLFHSQVINVSERESGYVIDGLLHNESVKSDIHSTDTFGFSSVVFGLTHLLGFGFAPRIKNFKKQQLYGFCSPKYYKDLGYKLIPKRKIREEIIKDSWDDILRFVITIKERKTSATQLLKRLTSYSRHHKLYTALKELGNIMKTDFLLNYIDDVKLRQRIEKQLNKVEASNKFSKAVFFGNSSEFTVATVEEQNIANNSKRLIQNAIILWNYMYITKKLQQASTKKEKNDILDSLKNSSLVIYFHINLFGIYDFQSYSKNIHRLITLDETKGFINVTSPEE